MAVLREGNWLGNQRVDIPHLRGMESAVRGDFDLLAGAMLAGKNPIVVKGFYVISTGITTATDLKIRVADSSLIHFLASESGSIFHVPADRLDEQLDSTNPHIIGSFTPSQVNYVGIDFIRQADDTTTDIVEFIDSESELETPVDVPLARTTDYRIVISTLDFDSNPGIAPIAKVTVDAGNNIVTIEDAREGAFRLGSGGTLPNIQHSFPWPAGRKENTSGDVFVGGDKAIDSFKSWIDSVMSRLWEVGGGEYWYSPTTYANERLARTGSPFVSNGEYFEWDGTNLHWKGLVWIFANSTGTFNAVADQTTDQAGLTDLADGECIYVDADRTQDRSGGTALLAARAILSELGSPEVPGSRYVIAWRHGANIFTRDQSYFVGSAFINATISAAGMVKLSATDGGAVSPAFVATVDTVTRAAYAAGLTRGSDFVGGVGDIQVGGYGPFDHNVILKTTRNQDETIVSGLNRFPVNGTAALTVKQNWDIQGFAGDTRALTLRTQGWNGFLAQFEDAQILETGGAVGLRNIPSNPAPATPAPSGVSPIRAKYFMRDNGLGSPATKDQFCMIGWDGSVAVIWESNPY